MEYVMEDEDDVVFINGTNFTLMRNGSDVDGFGNSSTYFDMPLYEPPIGITILLSLFYGFISLVSVVGNSTVIFIVMTSRRMQSVTNFFIANLALADVIIGLFSIPFRFQAALLQRWNLPDFMCPFCPFFENVSVNASIFTLMAIAVDRYRAILYPLKSHASKFKTKGIIILIWIASTLLAIPMAVAFTVKHVSTMNGEGPDTDVPQCLPYNVDVEVFMWYMNLLCLVQYFIPVILISFAYIRMAIVLWGSRTPGESELERDKLVSNNKKKVIKMLMVVVVMFTLAWLPFQLYNVLDKIFPNINYYPYINIIWFCCHWLAMSNSCYNPFIYFLCNDKFKKEARTRFGRWFCCTEAESNNMLMRTGETFYRGRRFQNSSVQDNRLMRFNGSTSTTAQPPNMMKRNPNSNDNLITSQSRNSDSATLAVPRKRCNAVNSSMTGSPSMLGSTSSASSDVLVANGHGKNLAGMDDNINGPQCHLAANGVNSFDMNGGNRGGAGQPQQPMPAQLSTKHFKRQNNGLLLLENGQLADKIIVVNRPDNGVRL